MSPSHTRARYIPACCTLAAALAISLVSPTIAAADPIQVHQTQGAIHGFLVIRSEAGATLGYGEFTQVADGERVTDHLVYHFHDGSLDDETTVFTQHGTFQLVSDHHIQHGPFFPKPSDVTVQANGQVTLHTTGKDGKPQEQTTHVDLSPDTCNGMIGTLLLNVPPNSPDFKLGMAVPIAGKPRLIHLAVSSAGQESFSVVGVPRKAAIFRLRPEIGGIEGVVAPIINKQPHDTMVWILEGDSPLFVREIGQLAEGAPIVSIEFAGSAFHHQPPPAKKTKP